MLRAVHYVSCCPGWCIAAQHCGPTPPILIPIVFCRSGQKHNTRCSMSLYCRSAHVHWRRFRDDGDSDRAGHDASFAVVRADSERGCTRSCDHHSCRRWTLDDTATTPRMRSQMLSERVRTAQDLAVSHPPRFQSKACVHRCHCRDQRPRRPLMVRC